MNQVYSVELNKIDLVQNNNKNPMGWTNKIWLAQFEFHDKS